MRILEEFRVAKNGKLEPIQIKMMGILDDMQPHWREELANDCLSDYDKWGNQENVSYHISMIRKHLAEEGKFGILTHRISVGNVKYQKVPLTMTMPSPA